MKQRHLLICIALAVLVCLSAIPMASAFTATMTSPSDTNAAIQSGQTINIVLDGLMAGDQFKYRLYSTNMNTSANAVTLTNVNMPFSFTSGTSQTTLTTTGLVGDSILTVRRLSDGTELQLRGNPTITSAKNIQAGNYYVSIAGVQDVRNLIGIDYSVAGTVASPVTNPATLSFTVSNVRTGTLTLEIYNGANIVLTKTLTIVESTGGGGGSGPSGGDSPSGGGGGGAVGGAPAGGVVGGGVVGGAQLAPLAGTTSTTTNIEHTPAGVVTKDYTLETDPAAGFSSSVSINTGTKATQGQNGPAIGSLTVTPLDPASVPEDQTTQTGVYTFAGMAIECEPTGAVFTGGTATVSFTLTDAQWAAALAAVNGNINALSIRTYDPATQSWVDLPVTVDPATHTVSTQVSHFSTYALFYKSTSAKTIGELAKQTPAAAATTAAAPAVTPAKTQMAPLATTTPKTPELPPLAVIGVVGLVGLFLARKRQ